MLPPKESNLFDTDLFAPDRGQQALHEVSEGNEGMSLRERITELESRNLYLQSLVVELLNKNEQLRRKHTPGKTVAELQSQ
ncbi:hypothetical protein H7849_23865 [Alloacidobacterium dinghuense]|uniref:Uncharacterized protein n=1 Tax=Alloacidobacterium dinghuense TaxID=2763107 RepID=A0A7G8BHJ2_9BACT|nr:hypothetical protein [Alloacidobacterium dinghuense]QNI32012.1 hypothetical protein H7849_23865 [Alloacidobacterium dinghuense]